MLDRIGGPLVVNRGHPLNRGRVAWWLAHPGLPSGYGGARWLDLIGASHGTLTNATAWGGTSRPGGAGEMRFDGDTSYVDCGRPAGIGGSAGLTAAAWAMTATTAGSAGGGALRYVVAVEDTNTASGGTFMLRYSPADGAFQFLVLSGSSEFGPAQSSPVVAGRWYRLVATYTPAGLTLYVDGVAAGTAAAPASINPLSIDLTIGSLTTDTRRTWQGGLDDVAIASRAWSAAEVASDYSLSRRGNPGVLVRAGLATFRPPAAAGLRPLPILVAPTFPDYWWLE